MSKILIITGQFAPYTKSLGGILRVYSFLKLLKKKHKIFLVASKCVTNTNYGYLGLIKKSMKDVDINYINKMKFNDSNAFIHVDTSNNQLVLNGDISGVRIDVLGMRAALAIDSSGVVNMPTFQLDKFSEVALVNTESRYFADYPRKVSSIIGDEEGFSINQGGVVDLLRTDSLGQISINHTKGIYFDGSANIMKPDNYLTLMGDVSGIAFRVPYADSSGVYINEQGRLVIDGDFEFNKNVFRNGQEWPGLSNFWLLNDVDDLYYKNHEKLIRHQNLI